MLTLRTAALVALTFAAAALPTAASAATVTINVRGPTGQPLADAVVVIDAAGHPRPVPRGPYMMEQRGIAFQPHLLVVPVGATVSFPNRDQVRHHVYSFSKPKKFDMKLYGREEQRSVVFDKPGAVALGCNIHDSMSGFIYVAASPFAARIDAQGRAQFTDVPAGAATVSVWSPTIRAPGNTLAQPLAVSANGAATTLTVQR